VIRSRAPGRLRVLTLVNRLPVMGGGAERLAAEITMRLDPERFERTLCVTRWPDNPRSADAVAAAVAKLGAAGVDVLALPRRGKLDLAAWRPLTARLRARQVDILHAHLFGSNVWGTVLGRLTGVPVVVAHEHTWSFEGQPIRRLVDRELIGRFADAFVAVSQADRRRMIEIEGVRADRVVLVPNGIPQPPAPTGHDVRAELGIRPGAPVIGAVGVLRPQKGFDVLVRAAARLAPRHPGLRVLIAGGAIDPGHVASLRALSAELGVEETVCFLGLRRDIPDVLAALDVAVSSSDFEGSPLAVMEYMDAALPIVATRVGGVPDLIEDGEHGLLVERRDPDALAATVERMLLDREAARAMGTRGRARRRAEVDIAVTIGQVADLYERLYAARAPATGITPNGARAGAGRRP
jgi:glycosyltransferase involved in cell wall biosynthesis